MSTITCLAKSCPFHGVRTCRNVTSHQYCTRQPKSSRGLQPTPNGHWQDAPDTRPSWELSRRTSLPPNSSGHGMASANVALFINSSILCPPMAVSAIPIGVVTPRSTSSWTKYQHVAPMSKSALTTVLDEPGLVAACAAVDQLPPEVCVSADGANMPRMFPYFPELIAARVLFFEKVYSTGSHTVKWGGGRGR